MSSLKRRRGGIRQAQVYNEANIFVIGVILVLLFTTNWRPSDPEPYAEYKDGTNIFVSTPEIIKQSDLIARIRRDAVRNAMKHAWNGYKTYAFGFDELKPISGNGDNNWGGMGVTLVDSLDTLWLMGMKDEFWEARDWVRDYLDNDIDERVSVFETTIRSLGGLLSAYDLSGDEVFLKKADDLGKRLSYALGTESGLATTQVNLHTHKTFNFNRNAILAETGTLQVEYRYLAKASGKTQYAERTELIYERLRDIEPSDGLYPILVHSLDDMVYFENKQVTFGGSGDSFYEYMLKIWLQGGKKEYMYRAMYDKAMNGLHNQLLFKTKRLGLTYIAEIDSYGRVIHKMDHLACFMAGSLALGAYTHPGGLDSIKAQRDLQTGKALAYTCYRMYTQTKTGLSPEYVEFNSQTLFEQQDDMSTKRSPSYILRPEAVESMFILNKLTGDPTYREWGWEIFQAIERYCKTKFGYGSKHDVNKPNEEPEDKMESFFLAETLKYHYLLHDPDNEIDILNKHVFNTEAHPLRLLNNIATVDLLKSKYKHSK